MNCLDISQIIKKQVSTSQIGLIITSLCFQIFILIGYIRSIILKDKELTFFIIPFIFIALLMESISFGIQKHNDTSIMKFILYVMITIFLSILLLFHFFMRRLIKYKSKIHSYSVLLLLFSILLTFILLI